jgi:prolipoprotein diacylglyceryl transferase
VLSLIASFPSPSTGTIDIGPLSIHMYGITLLVAIVAAIGLTGLRWTHRGGDWDLVLRAAVWGVAAGIVGARLYHVVTSYDQLPDAWWGPFAVWEGGLGIWGGILFGCIAGGFVVWRAGESLSLFADCLAPALLLAQGIGRWGNWWNQELFGKATDLPWALAIDPAHRPEGSLGQSTYHPTFLYELIWDVGVAALVIWADRRFRLGHGRAFALYVMAYTVGRGWIEALRIDPAHRVLGLRLNDWTSVLVLTGALVYFVLSARRHPGRETPEELEALRHDRTGPTEPGPDVDTTTEITA